MNEITVYAEGTKVVALGKIEGSITQIIIENGGVAYTVAWVNGQDVKCGTFNAGEVKPLEEEHKKIRIGFNAQPVE